MEPLGRLVGSSTIAALEQLVAFTESRNKVLAENIANIDTPSYQSKRVDLEAFQDALAEALKQRRSAESVAQVTTRQVHRDEHGRMVLRPEIEPAENITFHDGTNSRIEREMTQLAQNALLHKVSMELLRHQYQVIEKAIRGRVA